MSKDTFPSLNFLFKPNNIAIFEAKDKLYYFIMGYKEHGYNLDNLYLINPVEEELFGIKCYKSIEDIPADEIDLFILAVQRDNLIDSLKNALIKKKIKFIHIFSAGTGESDEKGLKIEKELKQILQETENNTRAIGPNCMGLYCPEGKNTYSPTFPKERGNIGLIFHSGDLHSKMITYSSIRYRMTFSKGVSLGNCIDLQISDFLEHFNHDKDIDFVCVYFEGFSKYRKKEGIRLFNLLKTMKKPVLILRGGRTSRAQTAVQTHTGSLGSPRRLWEALYSQTNVIEAGIELDDLIDYAYVFNEFFKKYRNLPIENQIKFYPKTNNALVILWSGGLGILDTDTLTELGINLPYFEGIEKEKLLEIYPLKIGSLSNPLDLPWIVATDVFPELCKAAVSEKIDLVILETDSPMHWDKERFQRYYKNLLEIRDHVNSLNKLFILIFPEYPHRKRLKYYNKLLNDGFIVYSSVTRAAKAFLALYEYGKNLKKHLK